MVGRRWVERWRLGGGRNWWKVEEGGIRGSGVLERRGRGVGEMGTWGLGDLGRGREGIGAKRQRRKAQKKH